ncbi:MAG: hypothetical protein IPG17_31175 [Sandaracinaceae bacterium]|nr:hypothetical protein [Sandaracinaceae bacterium]MBP7680398.1 hypothetical protein [Deltaproteobacteria bacterium]MBK6811313.1 hypothetical protein [Sandaracinaceae bacterium]MBK7151112.1 hypothetical protein [Sandaracinaceae bacterium]MBK7776619.1 hypothetical protein [Sandaracinaceae bacterium]
MHGGTTQESTPQGHAPFRTGAVIGERYEVMRQLDQDPLSALYECRDHEDDRLVWVRIASPALSPDADTARAYASRLSPMVGVNGPHLAGLRAVDVHQGSTLFVVEPQSPGTSLSAMLLSRTEARMNADELLPILVQLADALDACPAGRHHGEVRLERVFVDGMGTVHLTGAFLIAAAPPRPLATILRAHDRLRREFAPEVLTGVARDSADLFAAGQLAYQALTGERACEPGASVPARLGGVGDEIAKLIAAHPRRRPPSLTPLLEALARQAGTALPSRPDVARSSLLGEGEEDRVAEATAVVRHPSKSSQPPGATRAFAARPAQARSARRPADGDQSGTAELSLDDLNAMSETGGPEEQTVDHEDPADDALPELDEDAKTRQVKLADVQAQDPDDDSDTADTEPPPPPAPSGDDDDDDDDDDVPLVRPRDEATMKIAFADIKPTGPARRTLQGPSTLITRLPSGAEAPAAARPKAQRRRRDVIVPALFAAVVIVAASLAFALFKKWRIEQDQHERVREHIEQLQDADPVAGQAPALAPAPGDVPPAPEHVPPEGAP